MNITIFTLLTNLLKNLFVMQKRFRRYLNKTHALLICKINQLFISIFPEKHITFLDVHTNALNIHMKRYFYLLYSKTIKNLKL